MGGGGGGVGGGWKKRSEKEKKKKKQTQIRSFSWLKKNYTNYQAAEHMDSFLTL